MFPLFFIHKFSDFIFHIRYFTCNIPPAHTFTAETIIIILTNTLLIRLSGTFPGVQKKNVHQVCLIEDYGIEGDAHAGKWHRQVSLLSYDRIQEFRARGAKVEDGAFGENLVVEGIDFKTLPIGTKFKCNDVVLELTQIGKECHHGCAIFQAMGDCIMPREGVFTKVLHGGVIKEGDNLEILEEV